MTRPPLAQRDLRPLQLFFLAAAVFVVAAGYGSLLPLLPAWLARIMPGATAAELSRQVGFLSAAYTAGVLVGAPIWGVTSDRLGQPRILVVGLLGYVTSLLLLLPTSMSGLWVLYGLRASTGFFVAAVVPVVPALVAAYTPADRRARRFAWLGAASLLGFLFGPALNAAATSIATGLSQTAVIDVVATRVVVVLAAMLGAAMMLGLALTLPREAEQPAATGVATPLGDHTGLMRLWLLSLIVNFVVSGFELGIVLQGRQHLGSTTQDISLMFAVCSGVMLLVNAILFFTNLLDTAPARLVIGVGSLLGTGGLALLGWHESSAWMIVGISLTSAGTGLVLPVISFLAAGLGRRSLGTAMGSLAAAAGLGQTLGASFAGWLFGSLAQTGFAWLALPLVATLILLLFRRSPSGTPVVLASGRVA